MNHPISVDHSCSRWTKDFGELSRAVQPPSTTTALPLKCHSERPKGAKNLVPGWQFAAVKRDCFVVEFILSLSKGSSQ